MRFLLVVGTVGCKLLGQQVQGVRPVYLVPDLDQLQSLGFLVRAPLHRVQVVDQVSLVLGQVVAILDEQLLLVGLQILSPESSVDYCVHLLHLLAVGQHLLRVDLVLSLQEIEGLLQRIKPACLVVGIIHLEAVVEIGLRVHIVGLPVDLVHICRLLVLVQHRALEFGELDLQKCSGY